MSETIEASISSKSTVNAKRKHALNLSEKTGDLFDPDNASLHFAHCISKDCRMGAGVALSFVSHFGGSSFRRAVADQAKSVGDVAVVTVGGKTIYNLITKDRYFQKPTMATLIASLLAMRRHAVANRVKSITMPRIGCGLDKLPWVNVRQALEDIFSQTDIAITIIDKTPNDTSEAKKKKISTIND